MQSLDHFIEHLVSPRFSEILLKQSCKPAKTYNWKVVEFLFWHRVTRSSFVLEPCDGRDLNADVGMATGVVTTDPTMPGGAADSWSSPLALPTALSCAPVFPTPPPTTQTPASTPTSPPARCRPLDDTPSTVRHGTQEPAMPPPRSYPRPQYPSSRDASCHTDDAESVVSSL